MKRKQDNNSSSYTYDALVGLVITSFMLVCAYFHDFGRSLRVPNCSS